MFEKLKNYRSLRNKTSRERYKNKKKENKHEQMEVDNEQMEVDNEQNCLYDFQNANYEQDLAENDKSADEGANEDSSKSETEEEYYSFSSTDNDNDEDIENEQGFTYSNKPIYDGSRIFMDEFELVFMWICNILCLPIVHRNLLLQFIKIILPYPNEIKSYYMMTNKLINNKKEEKLFNICSYCYEKLKDNNCLNSRCSKKIQNDIKDKKKNKICIVSFDFVAQLKQIITKYWEEIVIFKSKLFFNIYI
jgi:hypothetical protein